MAFLRILHFDLRSKVYYLPVQYLCLLINSNETSFMYLLINTVKFAYTFKHLFFNNCVN